MPRANDLKSHNIHAALRESRRWAVLTVVTATLTAFFFGTTVNSHPISGNVLPNIPWERDETQRAAALGRAGATQLAHESWGNRSVRRIELWIEKEGRLIYHILGEDGATVVLPADAVVARVRQNELSGETTHLEDARILEAFHDELRRIEADVAREVDLTGPGLVLATLISLAGWVLSGTWLGQCIRHLARRS